MPRDPSSPHDTDTDAQPTLGKTVLDDLSNEDLRLSMRRDLQEVYQFYLDEHNRADMEALDPVSKWAHITFWVLKNSIMKLPPARRLLLLTGVVLFLHGTFGNLVGLVIGFVLVLLVLLLELKDKLLAQDELATGRAVQLALMPRHNPSIPGWETWLFTRPANDVGGDLVDYLSLDGGRLGLALGDVAGKGLGAALVTAKLQSSLRALAPTHSSLAELGGQMNNIFRRDGLPDRFTSLAYLEIEPDAGRVRLLNAGHMPPLVVRPGRIDVMKKGAPALGLMTNVTYSEQTVDLAPGDWMLVYSDGLTEARNDQGELFDDRRLRALLPRLHGQSAEAIGQRLLDVVDRFIGDARPSDDLSLVLLRRLPVPAALPVSTEETAAPSTVSP